MSQRRSENISPTDSAVSSLLTCAVCLDPFDDVSRQPKMLSCHHSFCTTCLVSMAGGRSAIVCPNCREATVLQVPPLAGVLQLQTNFYINQMKDAVGATTVGNVGSGGPKLIRGRSCSKHHLSDVQHFCVTCEMEVCKECHSEDHGRLIGR